MGRGKIKSDSLLEVATGPFSNMHVVINSEKYGNIGKVLNCGLTKQ